MPYKLNWYDSEHSILHVTAEGTVTWVEYHAVYDEALELIRASSHRVDVISDPGNRMPPGNPLPHFSKLISQWSAVSTFGNLYVVRNSRLNGFIQGAAGIAGRMTNTPITERVLFVATLDEALNRIEANREIDTHIKQ